MDSKGTSLVMRELPPDIILFHILPRLPTKNIFRFKCSSKQWYSLVTTNVFNNMQLYHQNHHKLLFISRLCKFHTMNCEAPDDGLTLSRAFPFYVPHLKNISIITSFNGLVLVGLQDYSHEYEYACLILWNPLTGDYKLLSKNNSQRECYWNEGRALVLYYSSSEDDYKLVRVSNCRDVYMYSLKSDSWRKVELMEKFPELGNYWPSCELLDEKIYFMEHKKIVRFDLKTEKFTEITSRFMRNMKDANVYYSFTVIRSCIHIWKNNVADSKIELWKMNGNEDWTNVVTYCSATYSHGTTFLKLLHGMMDGNWLMHRDGERYFCKVDPEKSTIVSSYSLKYSLPEGKYIETFESPNRYTKVTNSFNRSSNLGILLLFFCTKKNINPDINVGVLVLSTIILVNCHLLEPKSVLVKLNDEFWRVHRVLKFRRVLYNGLGIKEFSVFVSS